MSRTALVAWVALLPIVAPLGVNDVDAQEAPTAMVQSRFLLRTFRFDRALRTRGGLNIAVLYSGDAEEAEAVRWAFEEVGAAGVQDMPVSAIAVKFESVAMLLETFEREQVTAVYIPRALATALSSIQQVTRARKIPSMASGRLLIERGVSVGVFLMNGAPKLIVNRRSALVEGLDLSSEVLALAEVIR